MILCIDGSDIRQLVLAGFEQRGSDWVQVCEAQSETGPDGYLAAIVALVKPEELQGIVVVQGPGSATALRASLAIANTLTMTQNIPLFGLAKSTPFVAAFADGLKGGVPFLAPIYEHEARITPSSRDDLRRKV